MSRVQYFVTLYQGQWMVKLQGKHYGPYTTQKEASRAAIDAAHKTGGNTQVLVQGENNQFRTEWTYGEDPYPPPG
jgi:hypothetical protein